MCWAQPSGRREGCEALCEYCAFSGGLGVTQFVVVRVTAGRTIQFLREREQNVNIVPGYVRVENKKETQVYDILLY